MGYDWTAGEETVAYGLTAASKNTSLHHEVPHAAFSTVPQTHPNVTAPSNPFQFQPQPSTAPIPTQTITARTVFHEAQVANGPLIAEIQMQEQLDNLVDSFHGIQ
ncbi:hypothetical protein BYT27DRAFT_7333720 [Phlegmacium glaucopus]|nr:hypothetical protein BYT27DRAFT_7333720 [Phlegmacium glaucopus]